MADEIKEPRFRYGWVWAIVTIGMFIGLVVWVFNLGDELNDTPPTVEDQIASQPAAPQANMIDTIPDPIVVRATEMTALAELFGSERMSELVGRDVDLQAVPVESVPGDMAFWIGDNAQRRVYVLFDELKTPKTPTEGRFDIDTGNLVNISGEIRRAHSLPDGVNANIPDGVDAYIYASQLDKVEQG